MTPELFMEELLKVRLPLVFNPYSDCCPIHDRPDSAHCRRENLLAVFRSVWHLQGGSVWVARDLGYRGGRRTGLPLTDEIHLPHFSEAWGGLPLRQATVGPPTAERTAKIIWMILRRIDQPVFLWNLFPFHPHEADAPMSNRTHTSVERRIGESFLIQLLEVLNPGRIVAIGSDAAGVLHRLGLPHFKARHPSYGGQREFSAAISAAYNLRPAEPAQLPL